MNARIFTAVLAAWLSSVTGFVMAADKAATSDTIEAAGCVRKGVESGCLVLHGTKDNKDYNLFFTGKKPEVNSAISFEGKVHNGPTTCQQGTAVDVTKWTQIRMSCSDGK